MIVVNGEIDSAIRKVEQETGKIVQGFRKLEGMLFEVKDDSLEGVSEVYELDTGDLDTIYLIIE